jgi:TRAP transporter TAXI family solute receptor
VALCIATGGNNTVSFQFGKALAEVLNARVAGTRWTVKPRTASVENLGLVASGACDLAIAPADAATDAALGSAPTKAPLPLQALARLYDNTVQLVVPKDSNIKSLADLTNQTVSTGALGSCTEFIALRLLRLAQLQPAEDVDVRQLDIDQSLVALRDGSIQGFFWSGEVPSGRIEQFSEQGLRVRLIDVGKLIQPLQKEFGLAYLPATIQAKTYAIDADVHTVAVPNYLVANAAMDQRIAYQVTQQLFERRATLARTTVQARNINLTIAIATHPVPLHRGAIQYYRDIKP